MRNLAAMFLFTLLPGSAWAQGLPMTQTYVRAQIAADVGAYDEKPFLVGVTLTALPEWHIYWSNPGDAGIETSFKWKVPEGFRVEPLPMPLPTAFAQPGGITVYGYTGKTTFLFRVVPPAKAGQAPAGPAAIGVTADWLVCNKDQCEPGQAKLEMQLPAAGAGGGAGAVDKGIFQAAREKLPAAEITQGGRGFPFTSQGGFIQECDGGRGVNL